MTVESKDEGSFTWVINKFKEINDETLYSEVFTIGGYKWRLRIHPKGKSTGKGTHMSLYLYVADSDTLPSCWSRNASYTLSVLHYNPHKSRRRDAQDVFYAESTSWGWPQFLSLDELQGGNFVSDGYEGEGPRGSVRIEARIKVQRDGKYFSYSLKQAKQFKDRIQDLEKELNEANSKLESANAKLTIGKLERANERAAAAEKLLEQKLERANERAAAAELKLEDCQMRGAEKVHHRDLNTNLVAQCIKELEGRFEERFECLEKDLKELKGQPGDGARNCREVESDEEKEEDEDKDTVLVDGVASDGSPSPHS
ncbi:MATH domain and coiled-coil domain-containing protein [Chloropicon roscoffensis]|uniref:MATH domain and coiled-coil domain-containing protein n=1 Tax=Chloropicon roscoffensis TaxID=1461544 RepID=A0AAX4P7B6_9CHLO